MGRGGRVVRSLLRGAGEEPVQGATPKAGRCRRRRSPSSAPPLAFFSRLRLLSVLRTDTSSSSARTQ